MRKRERGRARGESREREAKGRGRVDMHKKDSRKNKLQERNGREGRGEAARSTVDDTVRTLLGTELQMTDTARNGGSGERHWKKRLQKMWR